MKNPSLKISSWIEKLILGEYIFSTGNHWINISSNSFLFPHTYVYLKATYNLCDIEDLVKENVRRNLFFCVGI